MDEYIGMVKLFAGNFAPKGWAFCDGSILPISTNTALFSILGTQYGGNGSTTFALPDLRGRVQASPGSLNGNTFYQGSLMGSEGVSLTNSNLPPHTHNINVVNSNGSSNIPTGAMLSNQIISSGRDTFVVSAYNSAGPNVVINPLTLKMTGNNVPHENRQPFLVLNYIICLYGVYPPRN